MTKFIDIILFADILSETDMLGTVIAAYLFLLPFIVVTFLNIYSVDKYEYLYYKQYIIEFKHKLFFVIMYSKNKRLISRKTLILEIVAYLLTFTSIIICVCSLSQTVDTALILLGIIYFVVLFFCCITTAMYQKIKKYLI